MLQTKICFYKIILMKLTTDRIRVKTTDRSICFLYHVMMIFITLINEDFSIENNLQTNSKTNKPPHIV